MKFNLKNALVASVAAMAIASGAVAGGFYTPGFPLAGSLPNTLPFTGKELIPADTQLQQGLVPQTEAVSIAQLIGAASSNSSYSGAANTASFTATTAQIIGTNGGFVILDMTNTGANTGTITTPTAAQLIAAPTGDGAITSYVLRVVNEGTGTWTLAGGTGVTVLGTATTTSGAWTEYLVTLNATAGTASFQRIGSGTK